MDGLSIKKMGKDVKKPASHYDNGSCTSADGVARLPVCIRPHAPAPACAILSAAINMPQSDSLLSEST
jgi:hypothetical protein